MAQLLIRAGADSGARDAEGLQPGDVAGALQQFKLARANSGPGEASRASELALRRDSFRRLNSQEVRGVA